MLANALHSLSSTDRDDDDARNDTVRAWRAVPG